MVFLARRRKGIFDIMCICGSVPKRSNGPDCKSGVYDFGGSNPSRPTMICTPKSGHRNTECLARDVVSTMSLLSLSLDT